MLTITARPHRALGALAALVLALIGGGLARPAGAHAASAGWYYHQLDRDGCWDAAQWWNGYRGTANFWLDTNNDCTFGETYAGDDDGNGTADLFWMRRGNAGNWASLVDVRTNTLYQGENQSGYYGQQYPGFGTYWRSQGYYAANVGPPSNPSGAYNLAIAFARQGLVYY